LVEGGRNKNSMINSLGYHNSKRNEKRIEKLKTKVVVFVIPDRIKLGTQRNEIRIPFEGIITNVYASCTTPGEARTVMRVEKIPLSVLEDGGTEWTPVADSIVLNAGEKTNSENPINIIDSNVDTDDYLRIVVEDAGLATRDIIVEVMVKMDFI
jgi:hypothetical protein